MPRGSQDTFRFPVARSGLTTYERSETARLQNSAETRPSTALEQGARGHCLLRQGSLREADETAADLLNDRAVLGLIDVRR